METAPLPTAPDDPSAQTLTGESYSFSHPQDWEWAGEMPGSTPLPGASTVSTVLLSPGTDPELLRVTVSLIPPMIDNGQWNEGVENPEDYLDEVADVPRRVTADNLTEFADWRVPQFMLSYDRIREGPSVTTIDGLPALYLIAEGTDLQGDELVAESVFVFDGETEYEIDCEYSPAKEDGMRPGCAQIFNTFRVTEESDLLGAFNTARVRATELLDVGVDSLRPR